MTCAYYNEWDPYCAAWLRNLIAAGHIAPGDVDERSVLDVRPDDLRGYRQCHFFAGIGGWSYALRLAGWPDDKPTWTASCPCQPFSAAGNGIGFDDERHLWPTLFWLIQQSNPDTVFGEQVAGTNGLAWLDLIQGDLDGIDYASRAVALCAAGVGAPHIRQRLYWVANASGQGRQNNQGGGRPTRERGRRILNTEIDKPWAYAWPPEPDFPRVVDGLSVNTMGFGNAIVPQVAAEFIKATMNHEYREA